MVVYMQYLVSPDFSPDFVPEGYIWDETAFRELVKATDKAAADQAIYTYGGAQGDADVVYENAAALTISNQKYDGGGQIVDTTITANTFNNTKKSWNVEIKVTYKGQSKLIGTSIFVSENDVSEDGQLTNEYLIKRCEALVNSCKERIRRLDLKAAQYDINDLVNKLLS